jgi:localization factor PodJL
MNGSRSASSLPRDRSSLDALNRTIEGLEARIHGLMTGSGRTTGAPDWSEAEAPARAPASTINAQRDALQASAAALAEIRERQRLLEQAGPRQRQAEPPLAEPRRRPDPRDVTDHRQTTPAPRQMERNQPAPREELRQPSVAGRIADANQRRAETMAQDFSAAFTSLRQELKRDLYDGVTREMKGLRDEVRAIKTQVERHPVTQDVQPDLARLAQGIDQLALQTGPEAAALRAEFEDLRALMDGLARQDSLRQMQDQWLGLEERIQEADASALREELVSLAYRIDDIRNQLGVMADSPVIRALEQKLLNLAGMMEKLGSRMQPNDAALTEHFGLLDERLDEISRAIAANGRVAAANAFDDGAMQRLEGRLGALMEHVEAINRSTSDTSASDGLSLRIELLAGKIEELAEDQAAVKLEERIEHLTAMIGQLQAASAQTEVTDYLSDITRKIDTLDSNFTGVGIGEKLDYLALRIEELEQPRDIGGGEAFVRIEDRLTDIAARLDEASSQPRGNEDALRGLEDQIAHLSTLISQTSGISPSLPPEFDTRMSAIEGYMATNDEYIVEAARQAAEAVVEAYSRNLTPGSGGGDLGALSALADDLKLLENLARSSDSRTHQTFEALHGTLVQIADRLDNLEDQIKTGMERPTRAESPVREVAAPVATPFARQPEPVGAVTRDARLMETSAISSTMSDQVPVALDEAELVEDSAAPENAKAPAKNGLFGGLARRFRPSAKQQQEGEPAPRALVEPSPSIDPSAGEVLGPEQENELLEPGSGAPDVQKILERVRASQAAGEFDRQAAGERADYIAAARRAAKAAAQEADPSQLGSMPRAQAKLGPGKQGKLPDNNTLGDKNKSAFSQHRRPILMAVGAVLLALMSMPLIKTVTGGQQPQPQQVAAVEAPADPAPAPAPAPIEPAPVAPSPAATDGDGVAAMNDVPAADAPRDAPADSQAADAAPEAAAPQMAEAVAPAAVEPVTEAPLAADVAAPQPAAAPVEETQVAAVDVPAGIAPPSLANAAASGDANALFEIGARFSDGRGVGTDHAEAAKWYRLAAERGLAPAQYRLGNLLEKGTGVQRNLPEAMTFYRKAAGAGNASAMHNLAVLYASGAAGQPDYAAAAEWFRKAADHGVADSQFNLAILYARGNGVKQDLEESYKWFGAAAKAGDKDAAAKRDEVAKAMRKEQLDQARAKLDSWSAEPLDPKANTVNVPEEWASGKTLTTASVDMSKAIRNIQAILNKNGFDAGTPDGKMGARTVGAIKAFQASIGQEPTGKVNDAMVRALLARNS